jgi:hypothetical protein
MAPEPIHKRYRRNDVVLTGMSRSGTTLACHLLNKLPNTLALNEPIARERFADLLPDYEAVAEGLGRFFRQTRKMALEEGEILSKHLNGTIPANNFGRQSRDGRLRFRSVSRGRIPVGKELDPDFLLVLKDPTMFTAVLPALVKRFPCYAIVRNPLAVLASWNSLDSWVRDGHHPGAELYDPGLSRDLALVKDRHDRQLSLLNWWFSRFERYLPPQNIIRYEELIASGGAALSAIVPAASNLREPLSSKNANPLYDRAETRQLGARLLASEGSQWRFYERSEVKKLLEGA